MWVVQCGIKMENWSNFSILILLLIILRRRWAAVAPVCRASITWSYRHVRRVRSARTRNCKRKNPRFTPKMDIQTLRRSLLQQDRDAGRPPDWIMVELVHLIDKKKRKTIHKNLNGNWWTLSRGGWTHRSLASASLLSLNFFFFLIVIVKQTSWPSKHEYFLC